jgi:hypothetical protein
MDHITMTRGIEGILYILEQYVGRGLKPPWPPRAGNKHIRIVALESLYRDITNMLKDEL